MANSALMSIGMRAMSANYAALSTTGHNIANANTEGYSRQTAVLETAGGQFTGAGFFGKGVNVATVERAHSDFLAREAATTGSLAAADATRSRQLQQIEKAFPMGENGIGYAATQMFDSFVDVAAKPQDASSRQVALARAGELAARFNTAASQIDSIAAGVTVEIKADIARANTLAQTVAGLNQKIAGVRGSGQAPNDLLDQRDQAIKDLGAIIQVSTVAADDGTVSVFLGGGQRFVLGAQAEKLVAVQDAYDPTKVQVGLSEAGAAARELPASMLTGGSLAGLARVQNTDIPAARNQLGQLAAAVAGRVNQQQALGYSLQLDAAGKPVFGGDLFAPVKGMVSGAADNAVPGSALGISFTVTESPTDLQASDYELVADGAGGYQLTRLADNTTVSIANNTLVDGMRFTIANPPAAAGDRFLIQPVASAARNLQRTLNDPRGLAAASPVNAVLSPANTGTATVASINAVSTAIVPTLTATITFTDNLGHYDTTLTDTTGVAAPVTQTGLQWIAGQPIALNGFQLQLDGVPAAGDVVTVQKTTLPSADNGNANALLAMRDQALVGRKTASNGSVLPAHTVTDAYADILADVGVRVQGAKLSADQSATLAANAQAAQDEKSGVNLDEEAARLMQFQQSYQAAAKMLQVAQQVFDTLLQTAAR